MGMFDSLFGDDVGGIIDTALDVGGVATTGIPWGTVAGAVGDLGSAAIGGGLSYMGQSSANASNAALSERQMAFQERMDNTKYQRAVKDLEKAGLNPMMAYGNMSAGSPSGSQGIAAQNAMAGVGQAVAGIKPSELTKRNAETENMRVQNELIQATTAKELATAKNIEQQTKTGAGQELINAGQLAVQQAQIRASNAAAARDAQQAANLQADNAKKGMMSNIYDMGESVTRWLKDKAQRATSAGKSAIPNYTIYGVPLK